MFTSFSFSDVRLCCLRCKTQQGVPFIIFPSTVFNFEWDCNDLPTNHYMKSKLEGDLVTFVSIF